MNQINNINTDTEADKQRQYLLSVLAKSSLQDILHHWEPLGISPDFNYLKSPEFGMVMVRAPASGSGQLFNMGEMTVTRCVIQLPSGVIGYGYTSGRDKEKSQLIAIIDACFQDEKFKMSIEENVLHSLATALREKENNEAAKVKSTKVDFFTMVRGE